MAQEHDLWQETLIKRMFNVFKVPKLFLDGSRIYHKAIG